MDGVAVDAMRDAWDGIRERYQAYELLLPGDPSFICQPHTCDAHCCKKFSVSVGDADRERMTRTTGLSSIEFLECEDGAPIALPMVKPYLLKRGVGQCALLGTDLACTAYSGRPDACRQYPYQVLFPGRLRPHAREEAAAAMASSGWDVALLVRHVECPGFTGPPLAEEEWQRLRLVTFELQGGAVR